MMSIRNSDINNDPDSSNSITSSKSSEKNFEINSPFEKKESLGHDVVYTDYIGERIGSIRDYYSLLSPPIGKGAFGEVRRAIHLQTNVTRAVKIIKKSLTSKEQQEVLINEFNMLKMIDHPNVMKVFEFFQDKDYFYIVNEYCNGGELFDKITKMTDFSEKFAAETMKQILSAVSYCHQHNIVHRDLKPENILYDSRHPNANIKIADFGASTFFDPQEYLEDRVGTMYYIAPEVLKKKYNEKCDIWSCGVILYALLCGFLPFESSDDHIIFSKILKCQYSFDSSEWKNVSPQAKALISKLLHPEMNKRYSALEALNDPWFKLVLGEPTLDVPLATSTLNNLKQFRANRKLQHAIWMFLVSYFVNSEEKQHLLEKFRALDLFGDGKISKKELVKRNLFENISNKCPAVYQIVMKSSDPEAEADEVLKNVDNSKSGSINYTEFLIATVHREDILKSDRLHSTFRLLDCNSEGFLTAERLDEIFNPGRQKDIDIEFWDEVIKEFDQSGNGMLSFEEFKDMMEKVI